MKAKSIFHNFTGCREVANTENALSFSPVEIVIAYIGSERTQAGQVGQELEVRVTLFWIYTEESRNNYSSKCVHCYL